jgi:hypothetical protein
MIVSDESSSMWMEAAEGQSHNLLGGTGNKVGLGGVVVSVLATGPKVAGSNPAEDDGF